MSDDGSQSQAASGDGASHGGDGQEQSAGVKIDVSNLTELKKLSAATSHEAVASWLGITPPTEE